jgi:hypothetical protein
MAQHHYHIGPDPYEGYCALSGPTGERFIVVDGNNEVLEFPIQALDNTIKALTSLRRGHVLHEAFGTEALSGCACVIEEEQPPS